MTDLYITKKEGSHRVKKVNEEIRTVLSGILMRGDFPRIEGEEGNTLSLSIPVTITDIDTSPDLKNCKVYIMPLGGVDCEKTTNYFDNAVWYFRRELARNIFLRSVPRLTFKLDPSFDHAQHIQKVMKTAV